MNYKQAAKISLVLILVFVLLIFGSREAKAMALLGGMLVGVATVVGIIVDWFTSRKK